MQLDLDIVGRIPTLDTVFKPFALSTNVLAGA